MAGRLKMTEAAQVLYAQLLKGAAYFNEQLKRGPMTPYLARKVEEFEKAVVGPLDAACAGMPKAERERMEAGHVPF